MMVEHNCIHEELLREHSLQITELSTRSHYKEQSIMEIKDELKNLNDKIDSINDNINTLMLQSSKDDDSLELELSTLKTDMKNLQTALDNKEKDTDKRINRLLVILGLLVSAVTVGLNIIFKII